MKCWLDEGDAICSEKGYCTKGNPVKCQKDYEKQFNNSSEESVKE